MLKLYYNANSFLEGYENFEYRDNFWDMLNKDIKVNRESDILYNTILDKFTKLAKLMDEESGIAPPNQMCIGELGDWSDCSKECGRGKKERRFNVDRKAGETGIKCIYEDGQIESKECFNRLCNYNDACEDNSDCLSNYCDQLEKKCSYHNICSRAKLHNCNKEQCDELNRKYGEYTYNLDLQRCENLAMNVRFNRVDIDEGSIDKFGDLKAELEKQQQKLQTQFEKTDKKTLCGKTYGVQLTGKDDQTCEYAHTQGKNNCDKYYISTAPNKWHPCFLKDGSCTSDEDKYSCTAPAFEKPAGAVVKCCAAGGQTESLDTEGNFCTGEDITHINATDNFTCPAGAPPTPPGQCSTDMDNPEQDDKSCADLYREWCILDRCDTDDPVAVLNFCLIPPYDVTCPSICGSPGVCGSSAQSPDTPGRPTVPPPPPPSPPPHPPPPTPATPAPSAGLPLGRGWATWSTPTLPVWHTDPVTSVASKVIIPDLTNQVLVVNDTHSGAWGAFPGGWAVKFSDGSSGYIDGDQLHMCTNPQEQCP